MKNENPVVDQIKKEIYAVERIIIEYKNTIKMYREQLLFLVTDIASGASHYGLNLDKLGDTGVEIKKKCVEILCHEGELRRLNLLLVVAEKENGN